MSDQDYLLTSEATILLSLVGSIAIPWPAAGLVLFTSSTQHSPDEIHVRGKSARDVPPLWCSGGPCAGQASAGAQVERRVVIGGEAGVTPTGWWSGVSTPDHRLG